MTQAETSERAAVAMLRDKMGPLLQSDDEARAMLLGLSHNPAVQSFFAAPRTPADDRGER